MPNQAQTPKKQTRQQQWLAIPQLEGSLGHVVQAFLRNRAKKGLSPHTVSRLYYNLRPLADHFAQTPPKQITARDLHDYQRSLWRKYAADTIRVITVDIRQLFRWGHKKGYLRSAKVAKKLSAVKVKATRRQQRAANEADVLATIHCLTNQIAPFVERDLFGNLFALPGIDPWMVRDLFSLVFLYETGARVGELVQFGSRPMAQAVAQRKDVYRITVVGKTNDRDRWFTQSTADLWTLWSQVRPQGADDYAVVGWRWSNVAPMKPQTLTQSIQKRSLDNGIAPFTTKALRHAKIKRARLVGGLEIAQLLVDHSQISTTMNYDWGANEAIEQAALATGVTLRFNL
jgi:site-specific recombinase XerD